MRVQKGISPPSTSMVALSFFAFGSLYVCLRDYIIGVGGRLTTDMFVLFMLVGSFGGVGVSGKRLYGCLIAVGDGISYRAFNARLLVIVGHGVVSRSRARVGYTYRLSVVGERLVMKSVGRESLRNMALLVRESMK